MNEIKDSPIKEGVVETGEWRITFSKENNGGLRADFDKIKDAIITSRKSGMTFKRFKGGTKSLGDYLTDIKAPKRLRDFLPILAKGQDVLAVLPYEISDQVAIDDNTKNIIYMKAERK